MASALLGGPNTRAHMSDLLERGVRVVVVDQYGLFDTGIIEQFYNVKGSEKKTETDVVIAGLGVALPKVEGNAPELDAMQEAYKVSCTHLTWALAVEFTEEAVEDNLYMDLAQAAGKELAMALAYTRQVQGHDYFNNPTDSTNYPIYTAGGTAKPLLSTSHYRIDGGTLSNKFSVTTALSVSALETLIQNWSTGMVDQRGRKYMVRPQTLLVAAGNEFLADRLLQSTGRPQSADNDINAIKGLMKPVMSPHLTDDGRYFAFAPKERTKLVHFDRVKYGVRSYDEGSTGNYKKAGRMRISHMITSPVGIYGNV
jgi:hypothetical protein